MKKFLTIVFLTTLLLSTGYTAISKNIIPESTQKQGCCSHHGVVAYCGQSGYFICNDGTQSPTCTCSR